MTEIMKVTCRNISFTIFKINLIVTAFLLMALMPVGHAQNATPEGGDQVLNVMTFNIQMTDEYYELNKKYMVADILNNYNVDIIGIQEYHIEAVRDLQELMPDYSWFGVGRDDGVVGGEMGPVFYKKDSFELLEEDTFWLSEWPDVPGSKSWNTAASRMVTWGRFRIKDTGEIFYLFNTHFDHISVEARENSSRMLLERSSSIAGDKPVLITGDFNFTESSDAYEILVADTPGKVKLYDSKYRSESTPTGPAGTYNGYSNPNPTRRIDYIFVNPFVGVLSNAVIDERPDGVWISDHYAVFTEVYFQYPQPPESPDLTATAGDGVVVLSWDDSPSKETVEPFNGGINDFEGYKLYRSRTIDFADAVKIRGAWDLPYMREPIFTCDLIDGKKGYTYYGIEEGLGYYLGDDTGLQHYFVDSTVQNGMTYFYMVTSYDFGIPEMGRGFAPRESGYSYQTDSEGDVISMSGNVVQVTPRTMASNFSEPAAERAAESAIGSAEVSVEIIDRKAIRPGHSYKVTFLVDSIGNLRATPQLRHPNDLLYTNKGYRITDLNSGDSIVYMENPESFPKDNLLSDVHIIAGNIFREYWYLNPPAVSSDLLDGLRVTISGLPEAFARFDSVGSGWVNGSAPLGITVNQSESVYFPWQYDVIFHEEEEYYTSRTDQKKFIRSAAHEPLVSTSLLLGQSFNFEVINKSFPDENGDYEQLDLMVHDVNRNGMFEPDSDYVLAGHAVEYAGRVYWAGTVFGIDFHDISTDEQYPAPGDVYRVDFQRPFTETDSVVFTVTDQQDGDMQQDGNELAAVTIVPNPYIVSSPLQQPGTGTTGRMMFTNLPSDCTIRIFTSSGVAVRTIDVNNPADTGSVFWDLRSESGEAVAPGYYIYHIESGVSSAEKTGKFAVLR